MIESKGTYRITGKYSFKGDSGISKGEAILYSDNRIVGEMTDRNSGRETAKKIIGIYDSLYDSIEILKPRNLNWTPMIWKLSKSFPLKKSPFLKELQGDYMGHWDRAIEDTLECIAISREEDTEKLKKINIEALKAFFNLHNFSNGFSETGTMSFVRL